MSMSLAMRSMLAATALAVAPAIASAQAATKSCKDGTTSTRSTFACWGHGGVDTTHQAQPRGEAKHHEAQAVQAGEPRAKHTKSATHKASKSTVHKTSTSAAHKASTSTVHHAKAEHHESSAAKKKQDDGHHGWLPWRHKKDKDKDQDAKKKKHTSSSHAPMTERPNGQPRTP